MMPLLDHASIPTDIVIVAISHILTLATCNNLSSNNNMLYSYIPHIEAAEIPLAVS